ncbi:B12-binding domain-containing radical SAM protein [Sphingomonas qilianensis]|uniref:Radical SAM protein n=1 Tax=Sphingomonas qilianensis TaxID=1736690 RepID=A0ABU9XVK3_9SPHN
MRVLFVDNLLFEGTAQAPAFDLQPHLGLMSLVAVARQHGHDASIFDPKFAVASGELSWDPGLYEHAARLIVRRGPDVVGFTALGCNFHCVVQIASALRGLRPDLPIVLGGPHATILDREILEAFPIFSAIARHEAETTLVLVLDALGTGRMADVPGISWRRADGAVVRNPGTPTIDELDELPVPAFDCHEAMAASPTMRVEAGRGCPFSCTFCSTAPFFGRSYRLKSADRIVAELDLLHDRYGASDFKLNHDLFTVNRRKVLAFCEAASDRAYSWSCSARVDCVDRELLEAMAGAGCRSIYFGIETGSARMQELSRKRLGLDLVAPTLDVTAMLGLQTTTSFIIGYPEETCDDRAATITLAGQLHRRLLNTSQLHVLSPEPGTALLARYGDTLRFDGSRCGFNLPRFTASDDILIAQNPKLFVTHYYYPTCVDHRVNVTATALWQQLSTIRKNGFNYLLDRCGGNLDRLLARATDWWLAQAKPNATPAAGALADWAIATFGDAAPIVSMLRHSFAAQACPSGCTPLPRGLGSIAGPALADGVSILRDCHDPSSLGFQLEAESNVDLAHLVVLRATGRQGATTYQVDRLTADLLIAAADPSGSSMLGLLDPQDLAQLQGLGIVVCAEGHAVTA